MQAKLFWLFSVVSLGLVLQAKSQRVIPTPTVTKPPTLLQGTPVHVQDLEATTVRTGPIIITASPSSFSNPYTDYVAGGWLYRSIAEQVASAEEYQLRKTSHTSIIDRTGFRALLYSAAGYTGAAILWLIATRFKKFRLMMGSHEDKEEEELREDWQKQEQDVLNGKRSFPPIPIEDPVLPLYYARPSLGGFSHRQSVPVPVECTCEVGDQAEERQGSRQGAQRLSQTYAYPYWYGYGYPVASAGYPMHAAYHR